MLLRRFAISRLHLATGEVLKNQIVEVWDEGDESNAAHNAPQEAHSLRYTYRPLTEESAFIEWRGGDFFLEE